MTSQQISLKHPVIQTDDSNLFKQNKIKKDYMFFFALANAFANAIIRITATIVTTIA